MTARLALTAFATAAVAAASCGDVPTLPGGVAYISPLALPSLAVAAGDTLRDSLGRVAPIRVYAFGRAGDTLPGVPATFVVTSVPPGVTVTPGGLVIAQDSVRPVQIVGQVAGRLQTSPATLYVVPQPTTLSRVSLTDSLPAPPSTSPPLTVKVTGVRGGQPAPVPGLIVVFQVVGTVPAGALDTTNFVLEQRSRASSLRSVDTTDVQGLASRTLTMVRRAGIDTVLVRAAARSLRGDTLPSVLFRLPVK